MERRELPVDQGICPAHSPGNCSQLSGVHQCMGNKLTGGCGVGQGQWCIAGASASNKTTLSLHQVMR